MTLSTLLCFDFFENWTRHSNESLVSTLQIYTTPFTFHMWNAFLFYNSLQVSNYIHKNVIESIITLRGFHITFLSANNIITFPPMTTLWTFNQNPLVYEHVFNVEMQVIWHSKTILDSWVHIPKHTSVIVFTCVNHLEFGNNIVFGSYILWLSDTYLLLTWGKLKEWLVVVITDLDVYKPFGLLFKFCFIKPPRINNPHLSNPWNTYTCIKIPS